MPKKLTQRQINMIAAIHSAIHLSYVNHDMFDDNCELSMEEKNTILKQIKKIASMLSMNSRMNLGSTENIIKYVREHY